MIRYSLICEHDHEFEGWFSSSAGFDEQRAAGDIACPVCGTEAVHKALMAPSVSTSKATVPDTDTAVAQSAGPVAMAAPDPRQAKMLEALKELKKQVVANSDYVGEKFPEEARKIHFEETEQRSIYGEASAEDVKSLKEDGVEVYPLPVLPDEKN